MSDHKEIKTVNILNPEGLHLRFASKIVEICRKHKSEVYLSCRDCPEVNGCSILNILMLAAGQGTSLTIRAEGIDAKKVVEEISNCFFDGGGI